MVKWIQLYTSSLPKCKSNSDVYALLPRTQATYYLSLDSKFVKMLNKLLVAALLSAAFVAQVTLASPTHEDVIRASEYSCCRTRYGFGKSSRHRTSIARVQGGHHMHIILLEPAPSLQCTFTTREVQPHGPPGSKPHGYEVTKHTLYLLITLI
ncbi:hypothetical protein CC1G_08394 [Coprinopsis cinerea okayama7|uniref:Uncharacterized protein n=1 Tax=Coprinopsis cinerea (strain Okayama-7 / 130 / ATCC MYA-4618 / FGSC 9003) TaxID=240176 RepID=A8NAM5_COPC7|nr:hypothetical protein CC1G_08394 [Coprinopsis cinerea okayama7\|eukprot:XP_001831877.2 hypothetical protein CC1G_08394 [Coprinopsis cinerea okayama7\